jgi:uncharacterized protein YpbB
MDICNALVLDVLQKINGSRRASGVYYILTGKKTSQSLSDSQWFGIERYYSALKGMTSAQFHSVLESMQKQCLIEKKEENLFLITQKGKSQLEGHHFVFLEKLNGVKYAAIEQTCWQVIALYTQAISNSVYSNTHYSPVVRSRDAIAQVKAFYPKSERERNERSVSLYSEFYRILRDADPISAEVFVMKLSGFDRIGLTFEQLAAEMDITKLECILRFKSVLHHLFRQASESSEAFPIVSKLIGKNMDKPPLTFSAMQTYELLKNNKTVSDIIKIRRLKESTLEDHLVEIARVIPEFSIHPYISDMDYKEVLLFFQSTQEQKLKPIKDAFPHLSYLQIRLVLAKEGVNHAFRNGVKTVF